MDSLPRLPPQPRNRRRVAWPLDMWPAADCHAWAHARAVESVVSDAGAAEEWRPATIKAAVGAYGRWLAWLDAQGALDPEHEAADRVTRDSIKAYVAYLRQNCSSVTVANYIAVLCMMIQAMVPERNWGWLWKMHANLHRQAKPSRNKGERVVPVTDLLALGLDLMAKADGETSSYPPAIVRAACDYRDGLMIALLAMRPLRQKNFLAIEIGRHLVEVADGHGLRFGAEEMKGKKPFQVPFPLGLHGALLRYLSHYRPILLASPAPCNPAFPGQPAGHALWVSRGGTTFTTGAQQKALARHTKPRFGHPINAHLFRDCVATTIAYDDPEHVRICVQILGHSHFSTTEGHYIVAQSVAAGDHYHELIEALRSKLTQGEKRKSRRRSRPLSGNFIDHSP